MLRAGTIMQIILVVMCMGNIFICGRVYYDIIVIIAYLIIILYD